MTPRGPRGGPGGRTPGARKRPGDGQAHGNIHYREQAQEDALSSIRENLAKVAESQAAVEEKLRTLLDQAETPEAQRLIKKTLRTIRAGRVKP